MKILCIGNNTERTDQQVLEIANSNQSVNHGLLSDLDGYVDFESAVKYPGFYHTSFVDLSFVRIKEATKYFDQILILEQPIHQWNISTEFYDTINYALALGDIVQWENVRVKENFLYWKNKIQTNKSLCVWPFIQMNLSDSGARLCCNSSKKLDNTKNIDDFHNETYKSIRKKMIDGEPIDHCRSCYQAEEQKIQSPRIQQTQEWVTRLNLLDIDSLQEIESPISFEITLDNTCNLQCRMCGPLASSLIEKEYKKLDIIPKNKIIQEITLNVNDLLKIKKIEKLYFTGGEPTINKQLYYFLEQCIEQNKTDFLLQINTNAHKLSNKFIELAKKFKRIEIFVSVDAFGKANDYIRWRSQWNVINGNIKKLINQGITVSFTVSLSLYGIFSFYELMVFLDKEYPENYVHCHYVFNLYPFIIKYDREQIEKIKKIKELALYHNNIASLKSFIDSTIAEMEKSELDKMRLGYFFVHNDMLDKSRNSKLLDYIPEVESLRNLL
jgi:hypothetical protein